MSVLSRFKNYLEVDCLPAQSRIRRCSPRPGERAARTHSRGGRTPVHASRRRPTRAGRPARRRAELPGGTPPVPDVAAAPAARGRASRGRAVRQARPGLRGVRHGGGHAPRAGLPGGRRVAGVSVALPHPCPARRPRRRLRSLQRSRGRTPGSDDAMRHVCADASRDSP